MKNSTELLLIAATFVYTWRPRNLIGYMNQNSPWRDVNKPSIALVVPRTGHRLVNCHCEGK